MILPLYEAKQLFANIDNIVAANTAFSVDLEEMFHAGDAELWVGDICLKHVSGLPRENGFPLSGTNSSESFEHLSLIGRT